MSEPEFQVGDLIAMKDPEVIGPGRSGQVLAIRLWTKEDERRTKMGWTIGEPVLTYLPRGKDEPHSAITKPAAEFTVVEREPLTAAFQARLERYLNYMRG